MTDFLPDVESLEDAEADQQRARWLIRTPLAQLLRDEIEIRRCLRLAHFQAGVTYLDAELSFLRNSRRDDGGPIDLIGIESARGRMDRIASGLPPRNLGA
ncbi:hypothetical protein [Rhizobium sp. WW_1]|jgi:hypothetical protein|uniref:hypothetical protein n=1 Tax=Rhizobium sp. WW_1 TaxID=1907375 RepID=UPI0006464C1E|nr:hypothetical protein [Rhizobium sp. WW_1]RKD61677.1 hypothetical protein BJ928_107279 [Rhizobium sp. WW_1]